MFRRTTEDTLKWATALAAAAIAIACSRPHLRSPYAADVDRLIATHSAVESTKQLPEPSSLEPRPWKVGQWSLYAVRKLSLTGAQVSIFSTRVVAEDSCGIWLELLEQDYERRVITTICFRVSSVRPTNARDILDRMQIVISERDQSPPDVTDFRDGRNEGAKRDYEAKAWHLLVPLFANSTELPREDLHVPAGHIRGAIRRTSIPSVLGSLVLWSHPAVPFDATVKATSSDGFERVLLDFGDTSSSVLRERAFQLAKERLPRERPRLYLGYAFGLNRFIETSHQSSSGATSASLLAAYTARPAFAVTIRASLIVGAEYAPDDTQTQDAFRILVGIRWFPFRPKDSIPSLSRFYIEGSLGYSELILSTLERPKSLARGAGAELGLGFVVERGHDWDFGLELSDQLGLYDSDEGLRHSLALSAFIHLYIR